MTIHVTHAIASLHAGDAQVLLLGVIPALAPRGASSSIVTVSEGSEGPEDSVKDLGVPTARLHLFGAYGRIFGLRDMAHADKPDLLHTTLWQAMLTVSVAAWVVMRVLDLLSLPFSCEGSAGTLVGKVAPQLPVVASEIASPCEGIGSVRWSLVRLDDSEALARELAAILVLIDTGRVCIRSMFTVAAAADGMLDLLYRAISRARQRPPASLPCR